ncbi:MAG TPA: hypothetical protein PKV93_07070 [Fervidobacterium sp.]|nr:hypothetical protein [Fervidobacterium sp.]
MILGWFDYEGRLWENYVLSELKSTGCEWIVSYVNPESLSKLTLLKTKSDEPILHYAAIVNDYTDILKHVDLFCPDLSATTVFAFATKITTTFPDIVKFSKQFVDKTLNLLALPSRYSSLQFPAVVYDDSKNINLVSRMVMRNALRQNSALSV